MIQANVTGQKAFAAEAPKARRVPDACKALGVSPALIYRLAKEGKLRLVRIAGRTLVPESEIDRLVQDGA
jgi:excisionase family DNA binding protein